MTQTQWFKLSQAPFSLRPDPAFLYLTGQNAASFNELCALMNGGQGGAVLSGEPGAGKTTLMQALPTRAAPGTRLVQIRDSTQSLAQLHSEFARQLQLPELTVDAAGLASVLTPCVTAAVRAGGNIAILVDNAEQLPLPVLRELLALTALAPAPALILAGGRVLIEELALLRRRNQAMRLVGTYGLAPLLGSEVADYVAFRIGVAHGDCRRIFERAALDQISQLTGGSPRSINLLCRYALQLASEHELARVGIEEITTSAGVLKLGDTSIPTPATSSTSSLRRILLPAEDTDSTDGVQALRPDEDDAPTRGLTLPQLQVKLGDALVARVTLIPGHLVVGRAADADVRLDSPLISRRHCRITTTSEGILLEDLGSTNGVQVNGQRTRAQLLQPGDRIRLGDHSLTYVEHAAQHSALQPQVSRPQ